MCCMKKETQLLAFLKRNLYLCKCEIKSDAYQIFVHPIAEYAVCSWASIQNVIFINWNQCNDKQQDLQ